jgi:hypothetical protein
MTAGTKPAYMKEMNAVRGVQRKYRQRLLFSSVVTEFVSILRVEGRFEGIAMGRGVATIVFLKGGIEAESCVE